MHYAYSLFLEILSTLFLDGENQTELLCQAVRSTAAAEGEKTHTFMYNWFHFFPPVCLTKRAVKQHLCSEQKGPEVFVITILPDWENVSL